MENNDNEFNNVKRKHNRLDGSVMLILVSVLLIIFGAFFSGCLLKAFLHLDLILINMSLNTDIRNISIIISLVFSTVISFMMILVGILGVVYNRKIDKAKLCFNLGILLIVMKIVEIFIGLFLTKYISYSFRLMSLIFFVRFNGNMIQFIVISELILATLIIFYMVAANINRNTKISEK